jgi:site-specific DNA recombinase
MRTVIYVRLSVHRPGISDPSTSPQGQEDACRAYCAAQGWQVGPDDVVRDLDVSGNAGLERPGLKRLREMGAERVVFHKIDRLARNVKDFHALAEEFTLVSVRDNLDLGTPTGRFVATILAAFAEMEREMIAARTKDARAIIDAQGRFAGGRVPYGYQVVENPNGNGKILVPQPEESALLTSIAQDIIAGGSLFAAVQRLNSGELPPRVGKMWRTTALRNVLSGEAVAGRKNGTQVYEPAIPLEIWAQLRGIFSERKLPQNRKRGKNTTRLSHVMRCAGCESHLTIATDGGVKYARCSLYNTGGTCSAPASVRYDKLEALVMERIEGEVMERPEIVRVRAGTDPVALRDAEDALEAAQARLRAAETPDEEEAALAARRAARAHLEALNATTGKSVLRRTGRRMWDVLMGDDIDAAAVAMQQVLERVLVTRNERRGPGPLNPERVTLEWAEYVEPGPVVPPRIMRGGVLVNQAEIDRYEREHGPMPY